ncbi:hypothetical protein CHH28_00735 [Bacterioplanes sanyensis]|uniref:V-type ATP synthase subunit E n=1 Tax=Bacterioplanes sanyensis TaxID=1249553 RepID=A0A222FFE4_9GAMM|nr:V-type ATP synthase subunit E family protein [Bacterioplanes sanyensis]ASP37296.1 hypothetical protein CHH28_00735 [Bacterioplanes sanyensis]
MSQHDPEIISSGIDALVQRLQHDGLEAGQQQAKDIIAKAEAEAAEIRQQAQQQANSMLEEARRTMAVERQAAEDALQVAFRDLVLDMKNRLLGRLSETFEHKVHDALEDPQLLQQLIREAVIAIAAPAPLQSEQSLTVLVPDALLNMQEIRQQPAKATEGPLSELAFALREQVLKDGIHFRPLSQSGRAAQGGFRVAGDQGKVQVDISDKAIAELLLSYLQPRFQAMLDGVIR